MKTCPYCNAQIEDNDAVCPYCGQFQYDQTQQAPTGNSSAYTSGGTQAAYAAEEQSAQQQYDQQQAYQQQYNSAEYQQDYSKRGYQQNANTYNYQNGDYTNGYQTKSGYSDGISGSSKAAGILSYCTWIGLLIAFFIGDRKDEFTRFHLNQGLVLNIAAAIASLISGWIGIFTIVEVLLIACRIVAIIKAAQGQTFKIPYLSDIHLF